LQRFFYLDPLLSHFLSYFLSSLPFLSLFCHFSLISRSLASRSLTFIFLLLYFSYPFFYPLLSHLPVNFLSLRVLF
jgi:hypothetical protein